MTAQGGRRARYIKRTHTAVDERLARFVRSFVPSIALPPTLAIPLSLPLSLAHYVRPPPLALSLALGLRAYGGGAARESESEFARGRLALL
jgi:hypothetical protein